MLNFELAKFKINSPLNIQGSKHFPPKKQSKKNTKVISHNKYTYFIKEVMNGYRITL